MIYTFLLRSFLIILAPLLIISLTYFLFLSNTELFSKNLERYKYKNYVLSFDDVYTNKNPLYPEITFKNIVLSDSLKEISIEEIKLGLNLLGYFYDDLKIFNYLRIHAKEMQTQDYISLIPKNFEGLTDTLTNLIESGIIEELGLEFINIGNGSFKNEIVISDVILNIGSKRKLDAKKAFIAADSNEVRIVLKEGFVENIPFKSATGYLDIETLQLKYDSQHESLNKYAKSFLPLSSLDLNSAINLDTSGFIDFKNNNYRNFGFIYFEDFLDIKYLDKKFSIKTNIFIEDFEDIFSNISLNQNDQNLNLFLSGNGFQDSLDLIFFSDAQSTIDISGSFFKNNLKIDFASENLNGKVLRDDSGFFRIDLYDSKINYSLVDSNSESFQLPDMKFRVIGKNIVLNDANFASIDFYYLKNGEILTLNDIKIDSDFLKVSNFQDEPAYFSINANQEFFKVKGSYEFNNFNDQFNLNNFPAIDYFQTDINVQWNNLLDLKNIEGSIDFLAKDFQINQRNPNSALLNLVGLLNIQSLFDGYDGSSSQEYIKFRRGEGKIIFSKKYGRVKEKFIFDADFGEMIWNGYIRKNEKGYLDELDLELSLRLGLQENIPWYAAIFGGIGVAAGTAIIGNVFEEQIQEITTIGYSVKGTLNSPILERL